MASKDIDSSIRGGFTVWFAYIVYASGMSFKRLGIILNAYIFINIIVCFMQTGKF